MNNFWAGIAFGAFGAAVGAAATIAAIASIGAASIAREARQEVHELRRHLIDRDLLEMLDNEMFFEDEHDTGDDQ